MSRLQPKFSDLFHDEQHHDSVWIRETGELRLPPLGQVRRLTVIGELLPPVAADSTSQGDLGLNLSLDGRPLLNSDSLPVGPFRLAFDLPVDLSSRTFHQLRLALRGVAGSNTLAWLGRITGFGPWQRWRRQARNRRLRIQRIEADGEIAFDFANRASPWNPRFARQHLQLGLNILGYFRADLGIGESVRCMARAAAAAGLDNALLDLRLPCKNPMGDGTFTTRLQANHPHPVNVIHVDPPGMRDLGHHHGPGFLTGKHTIGYWAWELPEFPDAWMQYASYCQEVWAPSRFSADAIAEKVPIPVLVMPHAIAFDRPEGDYRAKFGLPRERYLFLFIYDLNSYSERKNPAAVIEAFRASGLAGAGAALVIKIHNVPGNEADFEKLRTIAATLPGTVLITQTLSRREIYELESACDCFVSLHRSEGFGLAVAECMYLGKPVIATNWSATAEYLDETCGCPVRYRLVTLDRNHGPYARGQTWAEPDITHAAEWMRRVFEERSLGPQIGAAARARIEERFSPGAIGARYRRRLEALAML